MSIERCDLASEDCPWFSRKPVVKGETNGCRKDEHHLYWPANNYRQPTEKQFRQLPENREQKCRWLHDLAHYETPPDKPTLAFMRSALNHARGKHETTVEGGPSVVSPQSAAEGIQPVIPEQQSREFTPVTQETPQSN